MIPASGPAQARAAGVLQVRRRGGFSRHELFGVLEIHGPDALGFLETQLPVRILGESPGSGAFTAYLDAKGRITHEIVLLRFEDRAWLLGRLPGLPSLLEKLERHHIREHLEIRDRSSDAAIWELHGPDIPVLLSRAGGRGLPSDPGSHVEISLAGTPVRFAYHPWTGDPGGHLILPRDRADAVAAILAAAEPGPGLSELDGATLEILRIEGGRPEVGADLDERTLLQELDRPEMVSHDKGCYLGQETVARVHSRGHVNRLLVGLEVEGDDVPDPGTVVLLDDAPMGDTRSACRSPSLGRVIAMAWLRSRAAAAGSVVHLRMPGGLTAARVRRLPLHRALGPREAADALYREGLEAFKGDRFEAALRLFERATLMNPHHLDALESTGICLERLGRLEEAARTMEALTEAAPDHIMAWTNLSRYRAQAGQLEEAERIKGHVTFLVMKREAGARAAERRAQEEESVAQARRQERLGLFQEVLALDPEDVVANFGLGKLLLDLGRWEEAVPRFRTAIEKQPSYSMAYNHLGTCLLRLDRPQEAAEVWRRGIAQAARRGDLLPLRDMEHKLSGIAAPPDSPSRPPGE